MISDKRSDPYFESTHKYDGRSVDKVSKLVSQDPTWDFRDRLKEANLTPIEVGILTLKYTYDETFIDIANEFKMIPDTVERIHNEAIQKLRGMKWHSTRTP